MSVDSFPTTKFETNSWVICNLTRRWFDEGKVKVWWKSFQLILKGTSAFVVNVMAIYPTAVVGCVSYNSNQLFRTRRGEKYEGHNRVSFRRARFLTATGVFEFSKVCTDTNLEIWSIIILFHFKGTMYSSKRISSMALTNLPLYDKPVALCVPNPKMSI